MPLSPLKRGVRWDLHHLVECRDCGLFQRLGVVTEGHVAACMRCHATLRRAESNAASLACTVAAGVLFLFAVSTPLMSLSTRGRFTTGTLFSGPLLLGRDGMPALGDLVLLTLVIAPALKISILLVALCAERSPRPPRWIPWTFGWLERIGPWAMIDVFLLGVFVAYTRLRVLAHVDIEPSLVALGGAMLAMVGADASLDRHAVWASFERQAPRRRALAREQGKLVGCHTCGLVARSADGVACARCGHALHRRKKRSIAWSCAFMLAAAVLYIPANAYPIMTVTRMGHGGPHTLVNGVIELFEDHLWPLALIVLLASVIVPLVKLGCLAALLFTTHRRSRKNLVARTRIFRLIAVIGRWSMIDIFSLATLVAMVRMGFLANVLPGQGALAFAAVVVFTMLATECFDPRLMWDAAESNGPRALPVAERHSIGMAL